MPFIFTLYPFHSAISSRSSWAPSVIFAPLHLLPRNHVQKSLKDLFVIRCFGFERLHAHTPVLCTPSSVPP
eukprot:1159275-Pelagomonas_calceolata.AAC.6